VPLPNVKRLFRSRFQLDLSETALGHSRISDLLQDTRFQDICTLQSRGNTYVVVQSQGLASEIGVNFESASEVAREVAQAAHENVSEKQKEEQHPLWQLFAARTFLHFKSNPTTPARRSSSVPKDHGSGRDVELSPSDSVSTEASEADLLTPRRLRFCPDEPLGLEEASSEDCGPSMGFPLMTPSPQYEAPCYVVRRPEVASWRSTAAPSLEVVSFQHEMGSSAAVDCVGSAALSDVVLGGEAQRDAPSHRVQFCPDEPLSLEDAAPIELEATFNFAVVTPSPQYEQPPRSWMPALGSARSSMPEVLLATGKSTFAESRENISLLRTLGLVDMGAIKAIAEASDSEDDTSERGRTPMCMEPLSLECADEGEPAESEAVVGFPLMTPSPAYHAAASARYAHLRSGQQLPHPLGQELALAGARFEQNSPCALQQPGMRCSQPPRRATVGGA